MFWFSPTFFNIASIKTLRICFDVISQVAHHILAPALLPVKFNISLPENTLQYMLSEIRRAIRSFELRIHFHRSSLSDACQEGGAVTAWRVHIRICPTTTSFSRPITASDYASPQNMRSSLYPIIYNGFLKKNWHILFSYGDALLERGKINFLPGLLTWLGSSLF